MRWRDVDYQLNRFYCNVIFDDQNITYHFTGRIKCPRPGAVALLENIHGTRIRSIPAWAQVYNLTPETPPDFHW